ncbi:hypothetical protein TNCV_3038541 [Trichonephila clavipes]|nr:hypothetical protein TNCV_3038541 [Trichonephila clavipes]
MFGSSERDVPTQMSSSLDHGSKIMRRLPPVSSTSWKHFFQIFVIVEVFTGKERLEMLNRGGSSKDSCYKIPDSSNDCLAATHFVGNKSQPLLRKPFYRFHFLSPVLCRGKGYNKSREIRLRKDETKPKYTVNCMVLKAADADAKKKLMYSSPAVNAEFPGPPSDTVDRVALVKATQLVEKQYYYYQALIWMFYE